MDVSSMEPAGLLLREPAFASMAINFAVGIIALLMRWRFGRASRGVKRPAEAPDQAPLQPVPHPAPSSQASPAAIAPADAPGEAPPIPSPVERSPVEASMAETASVDGAPSTAAPSPDARSVEVLPAETLPPLWLGACASFHLLNALIFALVLLPTFVAADSAPASPVTAALDASFLLLPVCVLVGLSALLLASLTERLTANAASRHRIPLLSITVLIAVVEAALFALNRADLGYLVSQGAWLLACILMMAGLIRLGLRGLLSPAARSCAWITLAGFFARALLTLLGMLQLLSVMLPEGNALSFAALGGVIGGSLAAAPALKAIGAAWTGIGLLLMAATWQRADAEARER